MDLINNGNIIVECWYDRELREPYLETYNKEKEDKKESEHLLEFVKKINFKQLLTG
jgi:hypothetical protein